MSTAREAAVSALQSSRPRGVMRALRLGLFLAVLLVLVLPTLGQEATAPPPAPAVAGDAPSADDAATAEREKVPETAWLLPVLDLRDGEPVTWALLLCSIAAVTLIVQGLLRVRRGVVLPPESNAQIDALIRARNFRELIEFTGSDDSFVSRSLNPALRRAPDFAEMREALEASVAEETAEQFRRLDYINLLANVGPLLGLLGTVIGIMDAFLAMMRAGGAADVGALAGGISTALGTTLFGLVLAIPCLIAYSFLRNKADRLTQEGALLAEDFLLMMRPDATGGTTGGAARAPALRAASPRPANAPQRPVRAAESPAAPAQG